MLSNKSSITATVEPGHKTRLAFVLRFDRAGWIHVAPLRKDLLEAQRFRRSEDVPHAMYLCSDLEGRVCDLARARSTRLDTLQQPVLQIVG